MRFNNSFQKKPSRIVRDHPKESMKKLVRSSFNDGKVFSFFRVMKINIHTEIVIINVTTSFCWIIFEPPNRIYYYHLHLIP